MSKTSSKKKSGSATDDSKNLLERLPSNLPFPPLVRRPDYQLRIRKIGLPTSIPVSLITAVVLIGILFIYVGGFFDLAREPNAFGANSAGDPVVITTALDYQFLVEGLAAGLLMFIGAGGFFLINYSTQYAYSPRNATIFLVLGVGIVIVAWVALVFMLNVKLGR